MSYIAPIGQANLIERLGTIPTPYPSYVTVIPTDDTYATDDISISNVIRSQSDYVTVTNPYNNLHSLMQNEFYQEICDILTSEYQYVIDKFNELKTLYNIDYYDGDQDTFLKKISNIANEFNVVLPLSFIPYTNIENANGATLEASANVTKQNDFLRNIVKRIWLMRRWTGSLFGYKLPVKLINRIGAVHLGLLTVSSSSFLNNRIYETIDPVQYSNIYPNSSTYPNSISIPGAKSFSLIQDAYYYWDTQLTWDQTILNNSLEWDTTVALPHSGKRLFIEIALDRVITYINSISSNPSVCLMENIYLDTVKSLEGYVHKIQDIVNIGCQLSLLTSKDGYFNTYSSAASTPSLVYTHPNIQAKFQVFPNWNLSALSVSGSYIKIGTGGFIKNQYHTATFTITSPCSTTGVLTWGGGASGILPVSNSLVTTTQVAAYIQQNPPVGWSITNIGALVIMSTISSNAPTINVGNTGIVISTINFTLLQPGIPITILQSTATSGTSSSLTDITQNWSVNWAQYSTAINIIAGTGAGNSYTVASNTTTQITFNPSSYTSALDSTSVYQIIGTIDLNVFNSCGLNGSVPSIPTQALVQIKDLQSPVFSSPLLTTNEIVNLGAFILINHVIHSRDMYFPNFTVPIVTNNISAIPQTAYSTCISLPNPYVAAGSVQLGININVIIPAPVVTQNNPGPLVITPLPSNNRNTYYYAITLTTTTVATTITISSLDSLTNNTYTCNLSVSPSLTSLVAVMAQIKTDLQTNSLSNWSITTTGNILTISSILNELHQQIKIYEQYDSIKRIYYPKVTTLSLLPPSFTTPLIVSTSGVTFSTVTTNNNYPYSFKFQILYLDNLQDGQSFTLNGIEIPVYANDTYQSIAERIVLVDIPSWDISWGASPVILNTVVVGYNYYIYMSYVNPYTELNNYSIYSGYTTDSYYEQQSPNQYLSTAQMQCVNLLPLFGIDNYPSLYKNLVGDYRLDNGSTSVLTDYTSTSLTTSLSGTSTNVTTGTNGYIPLGTPGVTNGYSGIISYYYKYAGSGYSLVNNVASYNQNMPIAFSGMTIAFSYNVSTLTAQSNSVIIAKQNAAKSGGWGLYYTYAAGVGTLSLYSVSAGGTNTWSINIPTSGWHRVLITLNSNAIATAPLASIYIDSIIYALAFSSTVSGTAYTYNVDTSYPLSIGGFSTPSNNFTGWLSDIKLWNRGLTSYEIAQEVPSILSRLLYLIDTIGNSQYVSIDHTTGTVGLKFQYNPSGLLSTAYTAQSTTVNNFYTDETYSLITSNALIAISELGVFDSSNNLMAYATFPSVIYNPKDYHLSVNLLVQN
jgi:hypothetical protein